LAKFYDTLLGEYVQNPWIRGLSLDKLSLRDFHYEMMSYDSVTQKKKLNFKDVELSTAADYSCEDVVITNKLFQAQKSKKVTEIDILNNIDLPLIEILKTVELDWVKVNRDKLKEIGTLLENELVILKKEIFNLTEEEFNINSPKQVWEILFEKLALPKWKKTKTWYSVSADVLWELSHDYPVAQLIIDYRHYSKLLSTYIDWISDILDSNDFVHTSYNAAVTATGRLSSTSPNLQNIPSSHWVAWEIRWAFISRFEWGTLMAADYSQVEVRLLAIIANDENLLQAFKDWKDIHHKTAEFLFPNQVITNSERKIAKAVNFGVIYWISAFGLSKMINISMKDAKVYIEAFYSSYPAVKEYFDNTITWCETNWYVETYFGRKRIIAWINDKNAIIKNAAKREAINMPIQWTSADIIKLAMIEIQNFIHSENLQSKMILQVHDELVFDVYPWENKILAENVKKIMESILKNAEITLKVDIVEWESWKDTK